MTTTRYFDLKVTGCCECPCRRGDICYHYKMNLKPNSLCEKLTKKTKTN